VALFLYSFANCCTPYWKNLLMELGLGLVVKKWYNQDIEGIYLRKRRKM